MRVVDLFISATVAQVTLITVAALTVIWFGRRYSAFRHAAGVVGLVLVVASPLLVLALPRSAWLQEEKPPMESVSTITDHAVVRPLPGILPKPELAETPDVAVDRMPRGTSVTLVPSLPEANAVPGFVDDPNALSPAAEAHWIVEPASPVTEPPVAAPTIGPVIGPPDVVAAPPATASKLRSRGRGMTALFNVLSSVWCIGILVIAFRDFHRRRELKRIMRTTSDADRDRVTSAARDVRSTLGLHELPQVRVSDLAPLPFVFGVWKPIVVLPRDFVASAANERLRDVLIHECAHIVRKDSWVHLLQRVCAIVFWFHPGVISLNSQIGRAREELCDNFVLMKGDATEYAETLLDLSMSCGGKRLGLSALGLFSSRWTLEQRVGGLLDHSRDRSIRAWPVTSILLTILFASLCLLVGGAGLITQKAAAEGRAADDAAANQESASKLKVPAAPVGTAEPKIAIAAESRTITIRGKCTDDEGNPVANARVRLWQDSYMVGTVAKPVSDPVTIIAEVKSSESGEFLFSDISAPAAIPHPPHESLLYVTATAEGRASALALESIRMNYTFDRDEFQMGSAEEPFVLSTDRQTVSGVVTDPAGQPVAGARVFMGSAFGNPISGMWSCVTDQDGKYTINDLERWKKTVTEETDPDGSRSTMTTTNSAAAFNSTIQIHHPQFAITKQSVSEVPKTLNIELKPATLIEGKVIDRVTGQPAAAAMVFAKGIGRDEFAIAKTDETGRYRFQLLNDHYNIWVDAKDRIAAVLVAVPAVPDQPVTNADFELVQGGLVFGTVIDDATNQPLIGSNDKPYIVAHYGPACVRMDKLFWRIGLPELSIGVQQKTRVGPDGRFRLRVAPGRNGIFFLENYGETEQSPQIISIADGEQKQVELRVKLSVREEPGEEGGAKSTTVERWNDVELDAPMEQFQEIRRSVAVEKTQQIGDKTTTNPSVSKVPSRERRDSSVNRLLDKFERQSIGKENFKDPWLRTIKEIVELGPAAVPELVEELDATQDPWMLQLLGFVLRAIDDRRAVPALIRAIPKTLPSSEPEKSSFTLEEWQMYRRPPQRIGLSTTDPDLRTFAQSNQLVYTIDGSDEQESRGSYTYDSPAWEICGAITKMTGAHNGEDELLKMERYFISAPDQVRLRQQLFQRVTDEWSAWWQQHQHDKFVASSITPGETEAIKALIRREAHVTRDGTLPGSPVTRVSFHGNNAVTNSDLNLLKAFPNLRELWTPMNVDPPAGGMKIIGELHTLTHLHIGSTNSVGRSIVGPGLKELRGLPQLKVLTVCNISNKDLQEIGQFKSLTKLQILGSSIDDAGMKELKGLENLEEFEVGGYTVTDAGVADLAAMKSLKKLDLSYSKITDASLKDLKRLTNLNSLDLSNTKIKGLGLDELKDLKHLTSLKLNSTRVGDLAAKQIAELKSLTAVHLTDTKITDDAVIQLRQLKDLQYLEVKETEVTTEATRDLRRVLPNLQVTE